ncbi:MAG: autotransporter-associated beta strand repeat-containing protein [Verrucomicrobiaceae bacterium]|nr:autotransporter-associated beta strand repeat-containing protein [Verrucomicrobiaceae bacterium]
MKSILALITLLLPSFALAQSYGIASRPSFTAFNGGTLPTNLPTFSGSWSAVPAFPNLTFQNIMGIAELPGQPANARKLVVWEREGRIYVVPRPSAANAVAPFTAAELNNTHKTLILDISNQCQGWDDSGLLNIAFHPNFATNGYIYMHYTWITPGTVTGNANTRPAQGTAHKDRVARFTYNHTTGQIDNASEQVLINLTSTNWWHAGGGMFFHPTTGFLHITFGDDVNGANTQQITNNFRSSVIRIDVNMIGGSVSHPIPKQPVTPAGSSTGNYYIPNDNPFVGVSGAMEEIFCLGLRSPHSMNFDAPSGRAFIGDVGEGTKEEISVVEPGESGLNFQWNRIEGLNGDLTAPYIGINKRPIIDYGRGDGTAVIGGRIYRGAEFGADLGGKYIFGDNVSGNVWYLNETTSPPTKVFLCNVPEGNGVNSGSDYRGISYFGTDNDNEFYICQLGTTSAQIFKLQRGGTPAPTMPATISATGLLSDVANVVPSASFLPMDVNSPLWSDNAHKSRWFAIPNSTTISFNATGNHTFPQGAVWLKHFELPIDDNNPNLRKRLETRVLVRDDLGGVYGVTYKWRADGSDADIVNGSETEAITINGTSEISMSLTTTDIGTQVFDQTSTNIGTGHEVTIRSGDIWNNSDNFRFLHTSKTGDFDARVRIESFSGAQGSYAKAGIMARSTLDANSPHVYAMVFPNNAARNNNNGGHELQYRTTAGGASAAVYPQLPHPRVSYPQTWLRLKREGNTFIHYWSEDGTMWKEYGRRTQTMPATLELGLATTSNNTGASVTARYHLNLQRTQTWLYPGKADCLQCHRPGSGYVLGMTTAQTNKFYDFAAALNGTSGTVTDNQLRAWNHIGLFSPAINEADIPTMLKAEPLTNTSASAELRMRSYIDMNCAHCHQSTGGGVHAYWDGRFELSLAQTGIVNGFVGNTLGLTNSPKVIVPQSIERSIMHMRMATASANHKMPPLAKSLVDQNAMTVLEQWINEVVQPPGDPLPSPWLSGDIGTVTLAGSSTYFNGTYILSSNGADVGGTADSMQAASYQLVTGDGELVAQVTSISNSSANAEAGVMVRETLDANSKHGSTLITFGNQSLFSRRTTTGGSTVNTNGSNGAPPRWVKIRRRGPYVESFTSTNGTTWALVGTETISMAQSVYFCLVHSSGAAGTTGNATFDNVSVTPGIFGAGQNLLVNNTAANPITWDAIPGISGTSVANGPVLWYQNDTLNFTGTGGTVTLAGAMNMNTGLLNIDATTGGFTFNGGSLTSGRIRVGTGENANIGAVLNGNALMLGQLGMNPNDATNLFSGTITLSSSTANTGTTTLESGNVIVNGAGVNFNSSSGFVINGSGVRIPTTAGYPYDSGLLRGGLLHLTAGTGDHFGAQMVTLNGGGIMYRDTLAGNQTETIQNLTLASGGNTLCAAPQGATTGDTLLVTNLTRSVGATLEARSAFGTLGGTGDLGRVNITNLNGSAAVNTNGIIGGWAYGGSGAAFSGDFLTLTANGLAAKTPDKASNTTGGTLNSQALNAATSADNFLVNSNQTVDGTTVPTLTVNSLIEQNDIILNNGAKLVIGSGGLILRTANFWMQTGAGAGGKLTTGLPSGELFVTTPNTPDGLTDHRIRVRIEDNGTTPLILVKSGRGRLNLGGNTGTGTTANAYTGGTFINEGVIVAYDNTALSSGAVTVRPGGTLWLAGNVTLANSVTTSGFGGTTSTSVLMGALRMDAATTLSGPVTLAGHTRVENTSAGNIGTISGTTTGSGGIEKTGAGILVLSNVNNAFNGDIIVNAGTLRTGGFRGGYFATATLGANTSDRTITVNTGAILDFTANNIFTGAGASAGGLPKLAINGGTLQSSRFNVIGHLTLNGGTLVQTSLDTGLYEGYEFLGDITVAGTAMSTISSTNGRANHIAGGRNLRISITQAAAGLTISNPLREGSGDYVGTGAITKDGAGTLILTANNTYTAGTTISAGTLQLGNGGATGSPGTGAIVNNGSILVNRDTSAALTLVAISGSGSYTQTNGNIVFNAVNSFAGPSVINGGTLQLNAGGGAGGLRGTVTVNAGATIRSTNTDTFGYVVGQKVNVLNINGGTVEHTTVNNLTLSSVAITMNGGILQATGVGAAARLDFFGGGTSLTTDAAATTTSIVNGQINLRQNNTLFTVNDGSAAIDLAITGPITNSVFGEGNNALIKAGTGTLALNGTSTYTGPTTLNAGTLVLAGSLASPVTTNAAILAPQGTPSTSSSLMQTSAATLRHRINGPVAGTDYDRLTVGGTVTLAGALDIIATPALSIGTSFTLINKTSAGAVSGTFTGLAEGATFTEDGNLFQITYQGGDGNDVVLTAISAFTPIESWRNSHFGSAANTGNAADNADFDGDGLANLLEYGLGTNPTTRTTHTPPLQRAANEFTLDFTTSDTATDVTVAVESNTDLSPTWSSAGITYENLGSSGGQTTWRAHIPSPGTETKRFARIKVVRP